MALHRSGLRFNTLSSGGQVQVNSMGATDYLTYRYSPMINKLVDVIDAVERPAFVRGGSLPANPPIQYQGGFQDKYRSGDKYVYGDLNGNMTADKNKDITNISYNHLNLPSVVTFTNNRNITYIYDATGVKLKKVITQSSTSTNTEYAGGIIYENGVLEMIPQPEGYIEKNGSGFDYVYQYKDHLGSVRISYTDSNNNGSIESSTEILQERNTYPFGLEHKGYNNEIISENNYQTYQGQELEKDLGKDTYAYQWRDYDPALGRFNKIDRFAEKYDPISPYAFTANNPMLYKEIAGDSTYVVIYGAGYYKPSYKGKIYDVGAGFKKSAEAKAKEIKNREGYDAKRDQVVVIQAKTEEEFLDAVNKKYDTGSIAELTTYSHGTLNSINLGGELTDSEGQEDKRWLSVSDYSDDSSNPEENEFNQIDSNNFSKNSRISLYGCNLGGENTYTAGNSPAQAIVNRIRKGATLQAFQGGGGAEFMQRNGRNVYNGKMIRSADRKSQRQRLTEFQAK